MPVVAPHSCPPHIDQMSQGVWWSNLLWVPGKATKGVATSDRRQKLVSPGMPRVGRNASNQMLLLPWVPPTIYIYIYIYTYKIITKYYLHNILGYTKGLLRIWYDLLIFAHGLLRFTRIYQDLPGFTNMYWGLTMIYSVSLGNFLRFSKDILRCTKDLLRSTEIYWGFTKIYWGFTKI